MCTLSLCPSKINPCGIYAYLDVISFWPPSPFEGATLAWLESQCGEGDIHVENRRARFKPRLTQRITMRQPTNDAIVFLSGVESLMLNYVELALDLTFDNADDRIAARQFAEKHCVKRNHRDKGVRYVKGTRYTDPRWAPNNFVIYDDRHSKATGETECLHMEWRMAGVQSLRRCSIESIADLIDFDHRQFWQSRLLFRQFNAERLGRTYHNAILQRKNRQKNNIKRRKPRVLSIGKTAFQYHVDKRIGQTLLRSLETTQNVIDHAYSMKINVRTCMSIVSNTEYLPAYAGLKTGNANESRGMGRLDSICVANQREGTPTPTANRA